MGNESTKQPPVAVRVTRPYATEDAFIDAELDTVTRTGVVLLGTQSRPSGVVLRFELALESGAPLLRGEGRVVSYKVGAGAEPSALTLRFTRLDTKSKALVDRIAGLREERARQALQAAMGESSIPPARVSRPPPAIEIPQASSPLVVESSRVSLENLPSSDVLDSPASSQSLVGAHAVSTLVAHQENHSPDSSGVLEVSSVSTEVPVVEISSISTEVAVVGPAPVSAEAPHAPVARAPSSVLDRLRERSKGLSSERVREIQESGKKLRRG